MSKIKKGIAVFAIILLITLTLVLEKAYTLFLYIPNVEVEEQIGFSLYTVHDNILKMNVQMYPLEEQQSRELILEIKDDEQWKVIQTTQIDDSEYGVPLAGRLWLAHFRVEDWDDSKDYSYRINYQNTAFHEGIIRKDPKDKEEIVLAAFTGNSNKDRRLKPDIIAAIKQQDPDLLFFSGDQTYDHRSHLHGWLKFGEQFGEIMKDRPTVVVSDDHDVGQLNLWGEAGEKSTWSPGGLQGGYFMPMRFVNAAERAQMGHLPDSYHQGPVGNGLEIYYTSLNIGGVDFAIIEDRKFKSAPQPHEKVSQSALVSDLDFDTDSLDNPKAELLGPGQMEFLEAWAQDWQEADMKAVLSATIFANAAHIHGGKMFGRAKADLDSNGWPQTGRDNALKVIRKAYATMIAGDQHLATVSHLGIDDFGDAGFAFSVPSIVNYYPREWHPLESSESQHNDALEYSGDFHDGFNNKLSMYAYANPTEDNFEGAGYGLIRFNKITRDIRMECYKRNIEFKAGKDFVLERDLNQHEGWPIEFNQRDNYGKYAEYSLGNIKIVGIENPIVQVVNERDDSVEYTLKLSQQDALSWRAKVIEEGTYSLVVRDSQGKRQTLTQLKAKKIKTHDIENTSEMLIEFNEE